MSTVERLADKLALVNSLRQAAHSLTLTKDEEDISGIVSMAAEAIAAYRSTQADGGGHGVTPLTAAARDVLAERQRQVSVEGWTPRHDDNHEEGELSLAAAGYAWAASDQIQCVVKEFDGPESSMDDPVLPQDKAWPHGWQFKPCPPRRALIKAAALILAEIERLDRRYGTPASTGGEHA